MPLVKSLIIIDDDPEVVALLRRSLLPGEWLIESEASGDKALLRLTAMKYGVIIAALEAPGVGGVEFIRRLRRIWPKARVIFTALAATPSEVIESIKVHAFAHFNKPFNAEELVQMILRAINTPAWEDGIEILSASSQWLELRVSCKLVTADRLVQFLREMKSNLSAEEREGIATAFREMLVNAMEHGGQLDPDQTVEVSYIRTERSLIYCIVDPGHGFTLDQLPHAAISNPEGEPSRHILFRLEHGMRAGGFGIMLARKLVDELVYNDRGNKVLLIKYLKD